MMKNTTKDANMHAIKLRRAGQIKRRKINDGL
jgi:hypothetical protein